MTMNGKEIKPEDVIRDDWAADGVYHDYMSVGFPSAPSAPSGAGAGLTLTQKKPAKTPLDQTLVGDITNKMSDAVKDALTNNPGYQLVATDVDVVNRKVTFQLQLAPAAIFSHPEDLSGFYKGERLDMEWIAEDWPHAILDKSLIVWKRVHNTYGDGREYRGALAAPYRLGESITLNNTSNWLLSPLGCIIERYVRLNHFMAFEVDPDDLKMRKDQVLAGGPGLTVTPLAVFKQKLFDDRIQQHPLWSKIAEGTYSKYGDILTKIDVVKFALDNPNLFRSFIDDMDAFGRSLLASQCSIEA